LDEVYERESREEKREKRRTKKRNRGRASISTNPESPSRSPQNKRSNTSCEIISPPHMSRLDILDNTLMPSDQENEPPATSMNIMNSPGKSSGRGTMPRSDQSLASKSNHGIIFIVDGRGEKEGYKTKIVVSSIDCYKVASVGMLGERCLAKEEERYGHTVQKYDICDGEGVALDPNDRLMDHIKDAAGKLTVKLKPSLNHEWRPLTLAERYEKTARFNEHVLKALEHVDSKRCHLSRLFLNHADSKALLSFLMSNLNTDWEELYLANSLRLEMRDVWAELVTLIDKLPKLRELNLSGCPRKSTEEIQSLLRAFKTVSPDATCERHVDIRLQVPFDLLPTHEQQFLMDFFKTCFSSASSLVL